jgi:hypothetical protein
MTTLFGGDPAGMIGIQAGGKRVIEHSSSSTRERQNCILAEITPAGE